MTQSGHQPKYARYQDYVIRDGRLVAEFDQLYRDFPDPWEQAVREEFAWEKLVGLQWLNRRCREKGRQRVIELGCGLGHYTGRLAEAGAEVMGIDISEVAVARAQKNYPNLQFKVGTLASFDFFKAWAPDVFVLSEVTWYILDTLDEFLFRCRQELPNSWMFHSLTTYPPGVQKYGIDRFTNLAELKRYFGMEYEEWGEISRANSEGCSCTYFIGHW